VRIVRVALDVPLAEAFDFRLGASLEAPLGSLVVVPFGRTRKVGVVVAEAEASDVPPERLRDVEALVDDVPPFPSADLDLYRFCARYYLRPLGEVIATGIPPRLRQVKRRRIEAPPAATDAPGFAAPHEPTPAQRQAIAEVLEGRDRFHPVLLEGVTGSGKTEVYLHLIADTLARGKQALLMVPEIGLTPQFEDHVRSRFPGAMMLTAHSHLSEGERARAWLAARTGAAQVILGTRLAVLTPFHALGLIVVDEENDLSYKQQDGMRYSARDVAVLRAQRLGIPVVLGSATPSLESFWNAREGRYRHVRLPQRATPGAGMPPVRTLDTRADRPEEGLAHGLVQAVRRRLERGEQSLIFLNRRGYAPVLFCRSCQWHSTCTRCSANLVLHRRENELRCHHCGHVERPPQRCPACASEDIAPIGQGTQRVEETLQALFPSARIARVDRDSTARKHALREVLGRVRAGEVDILVGTQMLAKGHDYPRLTLVGVLDSDSALFSADFRAAERLFAQLSQVAGRAGRSELAGEVIIQTDFPGHPLYAAVASHDYERFATNALDERHVAHFPPYSHLALLRAESQKKGEPLGFLALAAQEARALASEVEVFDPVPSRLERKAGFERAQLLVRADTRAALQGFLARWHDALAAHADRRVRWAIDVDPQEV